MEFFASAVDTLKVLVMAIGCGLGAWGIVNLLEGYGADNPASKAAGFYAITIDAETYEQDTGYYHVPVEIKYMEV